MLPACKRFAALLVLASIVLVVLLTAKLKVNPCFALSTAALGLALLTLAPDEIVTTLKSGFGATLRVYTTSTIVSALTAFGLTWLLGFVLL